MRFLAMRGLFREDETMTMRQISPGQERWALLIMAFLFALAAPFLPIVGVLFLLGWTAPLVVLIARHGYGYAVPGVLCVAGFYYAVLGAMGALHTLFLVVPLAFFLGFGLRRKWQAVRLVKGGLVTSLVSTLVSLLLVALLFGVDPLAPFIEAVRDSYQSLGSAVQSGGGLSPSEAQALEKQVASLIETVSLIAPTIFIVESALAVLLNFFAAGVLLARVGETMPALPPFREWRFSVYFLFLFGFSLVGLYWGGTRHIPLLYEASLNGDIIATFAGLIQGFSLLWYVADHWKIGRFWRFTLVAFAVLSAFLMQLIAFTGLFDMYFDYRRRFSRRR